MNAWGPMIVLRRQNATILMGATIAHAR